MCDKISKDVVKLRMLVLGLKASSLKLEEASLIRTRLGKRLAREPIWDPSVCTPAYATGWFPTLQTSLAASLHRLDTNGSEYPWG